MHTIYQQLFSFAYNHRLTDALLWNAFALVLVLAVLLAYWNYRLLRERKSRHAAESDLSSSEERYRLLVEKSSDVVYSVTSEGTISYVSPQIINFGYKPEELLSTNFLNCVVPEQREDVLRRFQQRFEGNTAPSEFQWQGKDGRRYWVEVSVRMVYDEAGRSPFRVGVMRDITRRKRIEESLLESQRLLQDIIDCSQSLIFVKDLNGKYLLVNKAYEALFQTQGKRVVGNTDYDVMPKESADLVRQHDRRIIEHRRSETFDEHGRLRTGEMAYYASNKVPLYNQHGELYGVCGVSLDITALKNMEAELRQAKELAEEAQHRAESASRAKSEFLSNMSHELRTPLNAILGYARILSDQTSLDKVQKQQLDIIQTSGEHLLALISDILDFSKIDAQKFSLKETEFNLPALVRHVFNMNRLKAEEKGLLFQHEELSVLPGFVKGDERKLIQILLNLLSNALKYTDAGRVTLQTAYHAESGRFQCAISDTGQGIAPEQLDAIFEPFTQVTDAQGFVEGSGLGLTIVRKLVDLMQGRLDIQSEEGQGTTFTVEVELPQLERRMETPGAMPRILGYRGPRKRILLVDDNPINLTMLQALLRPLGFRIDMAESGMEALSKAERNPPDLVLLDFVMPEMDGLETLKQLKTQKKFRDTIVFGVSATMLDHERKYTFVERCHDFLSKPVDTDALLTKIALHLKLEWEVEVQKRGNDEDAEAGRIPPQDTLETIRASVKRGAYDDVEDLLKELLGADAGYAAFCSRIQHAIEHYDEEAILAYLQTAQNANNTT